MRVLVTYASRHGSTKEIAEHIAEKLQASGMEAEAQPVEAARDLETYDAFVVGSATYYGHWLKEATAFVKQNSDALASWPVWLFSSGPLGAEPRDAEGRDLLEVSEPREIPELREAVNPRDHRVFFGVLDPGKLKFSERAVRKLPAGRAALPEGDFRDWNDIEAWAAGIAHELAQTPVSQG